MFSSIKSQGKIVDKEFKYLTYEYQKVSNLNKMHLLPKIHNAPGRPIISNCVTPTEKVSEFVDFQLKPVMQSSKSYIKDSGDFVSFLLQRTWLGYTLQFPTILDLKPLKIV